MDFLVLFLDLGFPYLPIAIPFMIMQPYLLNTFIIDFMNIYSKPSTSIFKYIYTTTSIFICGIKNSGSRFICQHW
ncbi:hypothetical protein [uncultured Gammaproteobacteria bacterium]|nr:hypothetical protein [uncultured Gammaproteobacteria bacterium]